MNDFVDFLFIIILLSVIAFLWMAMYEYVKDSRYKEQTHGMLLSEMKELQEKAYKKVELIETNAERLANSIPSAWNSTNTRVKIYAVPNKKKKPKKGKKSNK